MAAGTRTARRLLSAAASTAIKRKLNKIKVGALVERLEDRTMLASDTVVHTCTTGIDATPYCTCVCEQNQQVVSGDCYSVNTSESQQSDGNVEYFSGDPVASANPINSDGFGKNWGLSYSWLQGGNSTGPLGNHWVYNQMPELVGNDSARLVVVESGENSRWFDWNGTNWVERFGGQDTLAISGTTGNKIVTITDTSGAQTEFYDPSNNNSNGTDGQFVSFTDADNNSVSVNSYRADGNISEVRRSNGSTIESWLYTWNGGTPDLITNVTLRRSTNSGSTWTTIRQAVLAYYSTGDTGGNANDLKSVTVEDASNNSLGTYYYRYWKSGQTVNEGGTNVSQPNDGLKFVFGPQAYARMASAVSSPDTAADSLLQPYADDYFAYNSSGQVYQSTVAGKGNSGGLGTFTYGTYTTSTNTNAFNNWKYETVETLPTGDTNTVFANYAGETMLKSFSSGANSWDEYYKYDSNGLLLWDAKPSAVSGYSTSYTDLVNDGGSPTYINQNSGLILHNDYYSSTTATSTTPGGVTNYFQDSYVQHGEAGDQLSITGISFSGTTATATTSSPYGLHTGATVVISGATPSAYDGRFTITVIDSTHFSYTMSSNPGTNAAGTIVMTALALQESRTYLAHSNGGSVTIYPLAADTVYRNSDGTGAQTTSYSYTWFSSSNQPQTMTITKPTIGSSENGPGTADTQTDTYDQYNRVTQVTDGNSNTHTASYDNATGAVTQTVMDSGTGHLNLTANYTVDGLGRVLTDTDANGNVTYFVYNDTNHETRVYPGWHQIPNTSTYTTTGPVQITREYYPAAGAPSGQQTLYDETLSITAPVESTSTPSGTESISSSNIQSLSRQLTNAGGQVYESDVYTSLSGLTYSTSTPVISSATASTNATSGNYDSTQYGYDSEGRENHVVDPNGTITDTVYDGLGEATSVSEGTNDTSANNMVVVQNDYYDSQNAPDAPSLSQTSCGSLPAATDYVLITYVMTNGETGPSLESSYPVSAGDVVQVASPPSVAGATGYNVYASTTSDTEVLQNGGTPVSFGTTWKEPSTGLVTGTATPPVSGVGDGNLTMTVQHVGPTTPDRVTANFYDWRDRPVETKQGAQSSEDTSTHRPITYNTLDNLGEVTETDTYDGDGVSLPSLGSTNGVPNSPSSSLLRSKTTQSYDDNAGYSTPPCGGAFSQVLPNPGQVYLQQVWNVDQGETGGTAGYVSGATLNTNFYYDYNGNLIAESDPGGRWIKHQYNGANEDILDSTTDGGAINGATVNWTTASTTTNDIVLEQVKNIYDSDMNLIETVDRQRFDNDPTTSSGEGNLSGPSGGNTASRDYYNAFFFDAANRQTDSVDFGTNAGVAYSAPSPDVIPGREVFSTATVTGTTTTLIDTSLGQSNGYYIGYKLSVLGGTDAGSGSTVTGYTASTGTLTLSPALPSATDTTSVYSLVPGAVTGTASSGSTTTLVDSNLSQPAGMFVGWTLSITGGTDSGKSATITGYNSSTHTLTFSPAFSPAIDSTSVYSLTLPALLTHTDYNAAGLVLDSIDPRGIVTRFTYDLAGEKTQMIADYTNGTPTSSSNQTTNDTYDGNGDILTQTAVMPSGTNNQTTQWNYGIGGTVGQNLFSNDLAGVIEFPDASTGNASSSTSNEQQFGYNFTGQQTTAFEEYNQTEDKYLYDVLGRMKLDEAFVVPITMDRTVRSHGYAFDTGGRPYQQTSYSTVNGTGTPVNQVQEAYNGYGQLVQQWQSDSGAVAVGTTPSVQYGFSQPTGANYSREISVTYPNGRVLNYNYNTGIDTTLSRVSSIADAAGTYAGTDQSYTYLGDNTIVQQGDGNGVDLTYIQQSGDSLHGSDGGDRYTGLDRFGRVVDQFWYNPTSSTTTDRFQLGYDPDGNVQYKVNLLSASDSELYHANGSGNGYDGLNRLTNFARGTLNSTHDTISSPSTTNNWNLDALGNWTSTGSQTRSYNSKNQITSISGLTTPTYDNIGNTTTDQNGYTLVYDDWNHLTQIKNGSIVVASYVYDANGDRVQETHGSTTTDVYFDAAGQALEERHGSTVINQYVWGLAHPNDLVLRDDNSTSGSIGFTSSGLGRRIYVQQDADWNPSALVDASGNVQQRSVWDPFGSQTFLSSSWGTTTDAYGLAYGFQDGRYDSATGYYHFGYRDYSPALGRFVQQDPTTGLYADGMNLYQAMGSNPVALVDPTGLDWVNYRKVYNRSDEGHLIVTYVFQYHSTFCGIETDVAIVAYHTVDVDTWYGGEARADAQNQVLADATTNISSKEAVASALQGLLHAVPGGTAADLASQGKYAQAVVSGGADVLASMVPGIGKAIEGAAVRTVEKIAVEESGQIVTRKVEGEVVQETEQVLCKDAAESTGRVEGPGPSYNADPTQSPGSGYEWRGNGPPGSSQGSWYNPDSGESLHPDLSHPDPIGPHYDYTAPNGDEYRLYPDGTLEPK